MTITPSCSRTRAQRLTALALSVPLAFALPAVVFGQAAAFGDEGGVPNAASTENNAGGSATGIANRSDTATVVLESKAANPGTGGGEGTGGGGGNGTGGGNAGDAAADNNGNKNDRVTICHATGSDSNPFVEITPNKNGVVNGHIGHQDGDDIIPAFDYNDHGTPAHFAGQNLGNGGAATLANGCEVPAPVTPPGGGVGNQGGQDNEKVTLCHATSSETNPFVVITVAEEGAYNGHAAGYDKDGRDVIPPFTFTQGQDTITFAGQNWNPATSPAFITAGCEAPPVVVVPPTDTKTVVVTPVVPEKQVTPIVPVETVVPTTTTVVTPVVNVPAATPVVFGPPTGLAPTLGSGTVIGGGSTAPSTGGVVSNGSVAPLELGETVSTPATGSTAGGTTSAATASPSALPFTGMNTSFLVAFGGVLLTAGAAMTMAGREQKARHAL